MFNANLINKMIDLKKYLLFKTMFKIYKYFFNYNSLKFFIISLTVSFKSEFESSIFLTSL